MVVVASILVGVEVEGLVEVLVLVEVLELVGSILHGRLGLAVDNRIHGLPNVIHQR